MPKPRTEFRLLATVINGNTATPVTVVIDEPVKWDSIRITAKRDRALHGFNFEYSNGKVQVDFTCENASSLLAALYNQAGTDAACLFQVVRVSKTGVESIRYPGKIDFNTYGIRKGIVSVDIIRDDLNDKLQARKDSPVSLGLTRTFDGHIITPPVPYQIALPGQAILETAQTKLSTVVDEAKEFDPVSLIETYSLMPNLVDLKPPVLVDGPIDPITGLATAPVPDLGSLEGVRLLAGGIFADKPFEVIDATANTNLTLEFDWVVRYVMSAKNGFLGAGAKFARWYVAPMIRIERPDEDVEEIPLCPPKTGQGEKFIINTFTFNASFRGSLILPKGTKVFIYAKTGISLFPGAKWLRVSWATLTCRLKITRTTKAEDSKGYGFGFREALQHVFGVITSAVQYGTGTIDGSLIGYANEQQPVAGAATDYVIADGRMLRNLAGKPPTFTYKDLINVLVSQHAAGVMYKTAADGTHSVQVESGEWFYRGGIIIVIDDVKSYREDPYNDIIYNKITVGYNKFPSTGAGALTEFNTTRTYQTPIITKEQSKEIMCPFITAGTAIEAQRKLSLPIYDEQLRPVDRTAEGGPYDDDGFLLHMTPKLLTGLVSFQVINNSFPFRTGQRKVIVFSKDPKLKPGDDVVFFGTGTINDNFPYRIKQILKIGKITQYEVLDGSPMANRSIVPCTYQLSNEPYTIRTDQRLNVSGIVDPASTYNLELTPRRMLMRNAAFINAGLAYKQPIEELKCIDYKGLRDMATQVKPGFAPLPGDPDKQYCEETADIALGEFGRFNKLFYPDLITASALIPCDDFDQLMQALRNEHTIEAVNMGCVSIRNPEDVFVDAIVLDITYNTESEMCDMVLIKKYDAAAIGGPACADYAQWVISRFENDLNADPNLYRFCRFIDFKTV